MAERAKRAKKRGAAATGLVAALKTAPKLSAPKAARARVDEWLIEIAPSETGKTIRQLLSAGKSGKLGDVVAAIAEASPYLWDLIRADPDRFLALLESDPEARFAALLADVQHAADAESDAGVMRALRRAKAEAALLIALVDIGGAWPVERVTRAL